MTRTQPRHALRRAGAGVLLGSAALAVQAQNFSLEGAVIDSRSAQSLGVINERGQIAALFRAQKAMTFGVLRAAGISLEQLPPDVRARIERFQTTNVEAFRAFSQGLDLKDQGRFVEAKAFFRRAGELDPGFALAAEQQQAMPDVNLGTGVQARAVVVAAGAAAVDRGKASFAVDVARATAALAAGQTVVLVPVQSASASSDQTQAQRDYTVNAPGAGSDLVPNLVAALTFPVITPAGDAINLASASEWRADSYRASAGVLDSLGSLNAGFYAQRLAASTINAGSKPLADGSTAYWGSWLSTPAASASVKLGTEPAAVAPELGNVDYVYGTATRQMPTTGTATFAPTGGMLGAPGGSIAVNFVTRGVALQNLGFTIGPLAFGGLNGQATYSATSPSGAFGGNYDSGSCSGCVAFNPGASRFNGNFIGRNADGLVFSTFLNTGAVNNAAGVQLLTR